MGAVPQAAVTKAEEHKAVAHALKAVVLRAQAFADAPVAPSMAALCGLLGAVPLVVASTSTVANECAHARACCADGEGVRGAYAGANHTRSLAPSACALSCRSVR